MDFVHNPYRCGPLRVGGYVRTAQQYAGHRLRRSLCWRVAPVALTDCVVNEARRIFTAANQQRLNPRDRNKEKCPLVRRTSDHVRLVRRTSDHVRLTCPPIFSLVQKIVHRSTQNYKFRQKTSTMIKQSQLFHATARLLVFTASVTSIYCLGY